MSLPEPPSAAIDPFFAAALGAGEWTHALAALERVMSFSSAALTVFEGERSPIASVWHNIPPGIVADYGAHYHRIDPCCTFLHPGARITHDARYIAEADMDRSEFYTWKEREDGTRYHLGGQTSPGLPFKATLTLHRPRAAGPAGPAEIHRFSAIFTQIELALAINHRLQLARTETSLAADLLEHNHNGVIMLDRAGRILFANRAACAMAALGDGFKFAPDGLHTARASDDAALQRLLHAVMGPGTDCRGGALRLRRRGGKRDYALVAAPIAPADAGTLFPHAMPAALLTITDPAPTAISAPACLAALYNLTPAEVRVAERVLHGDVPKQAAAALGISVKTVRDHLERVFRKTGTNRQADLLRLLLSLPR
jgi:DNA-binding CsgD family transcriptional regulator/PAS domain-containing protein